MLSTATTMTAEEAATLLAQFVNTRMDPAYFLTWQVPLWLGITTQLQNKNTEMAQALRPCILAGMTEADMALSAAVTGIETCYLHQ